MADKRERARDLAEEGLDRLIEGDEKGKELIEKAKKLDPDAVAELAEEVERDKEQAERFTGRRLSAAVIDRSNRRGRVANRAPLRSVQYRNPLKENAMTPETFRRWLADRGCDFEPHPREKSGGVPSVTVRRNGRKAEIPAASSTNTDLDPEEVRRIVEALDLDWRELPGQEAFSRNFGKRSPARRVSPGESLGRVGSAPRVLRGGR